MSDNTKFSPNHLRLGVNIDHVATLRNARGGVHPEPVRAAMLAERAGADGITAHLREDRRHIIEDDIAALKEQIDLPLNLEMAPTEDMLHFALGHQPNACCLVPERRQELTTEGGLNVADAVVYLAPYVDALKNGGVKVSLFIDPDEAQLEAAAEIEADIVELHTGTYCEALIKDNEAGSLELERLKTAATQAHALGLEVHAGHGLGFKSVGPVAAISELSELNIGHFLIGEAIFDGFEKTIKKMRLLMDQARKDI